MALIFAKVLSFLRYDQSVDFVHPVQAVIPGVQGRVLGVLAETTAELSLSTLARLADVSIAQASRVMPRLVELGIVERREVPPSSQFRLNREHVAAQAVLGLADARTTALRRIGDAASSITPTPASIVVFGSFARGDAVGESDIDLLVVRRDDTDEDDERWSETLEAWRQQVRAVTGNAVEVLEASVSDVGRKLKRHAELWHDIERDGVVVFGDALHALMEPVSG